MTSRISRASLTRLSIALAIASLLGLIWLQRGSHADKTVSRPNGGLVVDSADLNLGEVWEQPRLERIVHVKNPTTSPVQVEALRSGCSCTSVQPQTFVLGPGEEKEVHVTLDLLPRVAHPVGGESQDIIREFHVGLYPQVSAATPAPTEEWKIVARVRKPLLLDQEVVDFGDVSVLESQPQSKTIRARCLDPVTSLSASCAPEFGAVEVLPPKDSTSPHELRISLAKDLPLGRFEFDLKFSPNVPTGTSLPDRTVRVTGRIVNDVQAIPPEVALGALRVGTPAEETILLRSLTGRSFSVQSSESTIEGVTISLTPAPNDRATCRMTVRPKDVGAKSGSVRLKIVSGEASSIVPLWFSYIGLPSADTASRGGSSPGRPNLGS